MGHLRVALFLCQVPEKPVAHFYNLDTMISKSNPDRTRRIGAIDALRGLVIILMALDHSRDFLGDVRINPESIEHTTTVLFFTRWFTHLCATTFVFLAGLSAWLYGEKIGSRTQLAWYLVTRGLWLIFLEFTVIRFGLLFSLTLGPGMFLVIAAIGVSMILLGCCCRWPRIAVLLLGIAIVAGHNGLDAIPDVGQGTSGLWTLALRPGYIPQLNLAVGYPILPWFGIMALGYGLSPYLTQSKFRKRNALILGLFLFSLFMVMRCGDQYGDPKKWAWQTVSAPDSAAIADHSDIAPDSTKASISYTKSMYSFLATNKYPPSLLFTMMTLGLSLMLYSLLDHLGNNHWLVRFFRVFGSVPLFFYVLHFYLLNLIAITLYWLIRGIYLPPMRIDVLPEAPKDYGFNGPGWLVQVYLGWVLVVAILFPICRWYRSRKRASKSPIWSYL